MLHPARTATTGARMRAVRVVVASLVLAIFTVGVSAAPTFAWGASSFSVEDEQLLFTLTNHDRASAGLNALSNDSFLHREAEWRAKDMGLRNYFSHSIPPDGLKVFYYMQKAGYCFKVAGENIGLSTYGDAEATSRIEKAFMASPGHRANILGTWTRMGVGAYKAADGRKLYAVLFSVPCSARIPSKPATKTGPAASPTPTPTPTPTPEPTLAPAFTGPPFVVPPATPHPTTEQVAVADKPNLRVRDQADAPGPLDILFRLFFGGLFH